MNLDGRNLSLEMRGEDVRRLQTELRQLGFNLDVSGVFDTVTFVAVEQFQRDRNLTPTGIVDAETARRINAEVDAQNDQPYVVRGQVRRADGTLVSNVVVRLQKKRLRDDQLLGQANVDVGQYSIPYRPDEPPISIFVEAVTPGVGEPLVTSAVICSANPVEVVDLTLDGEYRGPSEFKQLQDALLPILKREQVDAATLDEADVALLACKHDLNAQHLAYLVVSVRLGREINAQPEPFYALVRQGLPPVIEALVAQDQDVLQQAMEASVRDNIVGAHIQDQISDILERLQQHIVTLALRDPKPDRPTLKAYLNLASVPQTRQASLVDRYLKHEGPVQTFWQGLRASDDFEESEVDRIQDTLRIATISLNHLPLIARLAQQYSAGQSGSLRTFLSRLRPAQWRQLLEQPTGGEAIGAPVIFGEDKAQAMERYAAFLPRMVEAVYPTAVLSQQLQQVNPERFAPLTQFLDRTGFEFREQRFRDYLREHPDEFEGDAPQLIKTTERLFRIAPAFNKAAIVNGLMERDLDNVVKIRRQGVVRFTRDNADLFEGAFEAQQTYSRAARLADTGLFVLSQSSLFNPVAVAAVPHRLLDNAVADTGIPDLSDLFGQLDFCQCEHCASVYSPAAYLVDALHFLMNRLDAEGRPVLEVLFDRRPDLGLIELNCDNTHTPLPYVDLVLEILENAVASQDIAGNIQLPTDDEGNPIWFQTTESAAVLEAIPEHTNAEAYRVLAEAIYPWQLPFDLWVEEARVYLTHLGVPRYDLMAQFRRDNDAPWSIEVAAEYLGLTPRDRTLITGNATEHPRRFWGLRLIGWNGLLSTRRVRVVLQQSGLTYDELTALLRVDFVHPGSPLQVQFEQPNCDLDQATIPDLDATALDRIHRFVRLQRKLDWPTEELGMALAVLEAPDLTDEVLMQIAQIQQLRQDLSPGPHGKLETILSWWASRLDRVRRSDQTRSLYGQVFLDPTIHNPKLEDFELEALTQNPERTITDPDYAAIVQGALGISADALAQLVAQDLPNDQLNVTNLTRLFQASSLAKALRLSIADYVAVRALSGLDPFEVTQPAAMGQFIQPVRAIQSSGFSVATLEYLLRHQSVPTVAHSDDEIVAFLQTLRDGLQQLEVDYARSDEIPLSTQIASHLATVVPGEAANRILAFLDATHQNREPQPQQIDLINAHLSEFLDPLEAQANLVGEGTLTNPGILTANEARYDYVLTALLAYLKQQARHNQVIQAVSAAFGIDLAIAAPLLTQWVVHPSGEAAMALFLSEALLGIDPPLEITVANFPDQVALFQRLEKIAIILQTLAIPPEATGLMLTQLPAVGWLDLTALPLDPTAADPSQFDAWVRMTNIILSAQALPGGLSSFFDLLNTLHQLAPSRPDFLSLLAERSGWRLVDLEVLCGETGFGYTFPADFLDGGWLVQLAPCFTLLQRLGVTAADALEWAVLNSGEDAIAAAQATARKIKQTVRGKYDEAQWSALAKPLRDRLREQQRAAAVTYLVHHITQPQRLRNANDLYDKYLIDVEMDPCLITSRIKQAISSVQLFVQRCFMNLEPDVAFTPDDAKEWAWMKNYRVWEANRKVFLYPENWIQPELRDDKTELFRELESGLLQDETTEAVVERELLKYLKSLNRIAQLNICGLYLEGEIHRQVLHVVARTQNTPHIYYYRTWVNQRYWTAWQHIDVDIEGDHLVPIVWNRRLYLFWPMFVEKAVEEIVDEGDAKKPKRFYEIKLFWTDYKDNQWQPKQLTNEFLTTPAKRTSVDPKQFSFWAALTKAGGLAVYCNQLLNQFHFVNCEGTLKPERVAPTKLIQNPPGTARHFNAFQEIGEKKLKLVTSGKLEDLGVPGYLYQLPNDQKVAEVLRKTPGTFSIIPSHAERPLQSRLPFFYQDEQRTFFVVPKGKYTGGYNSGGSLDSLTFELNQANAIPMELPDTIVTVTAAYAQARLAQSVNTGEPPNGERPATGRPTGRPTDQPTTGRPNGERLNTVTRFVAESLASAPTLSLASAPATFEPPTLDNVGLAQQVLSVNPALARAAFPKRWEAKFFRFENFYHPYVCLLIEQLERHGIGGIYTPDPEQEPSASKRDAVDALHRQTNAKPVLYEYLPNNQVVSNVYKIENLLAYFAAGPLEEFDFSYEGAYAIYNRELFCHAPFMVAKHLSNHQKFAEAQNWFHYIFNPLYVPQAGKAESRPARFWQIKPFFEQGVGKPIQETMLLLKSSGLTAKEREVRKRLQDQIEAWRQQPFNPHLIARMRPEAYMKAVVMAYLDNLIAWGDHLFQQEAIESINEATQIYILAAKILGERPQKIATPENTRKTINGEEVKTFNDLRGRLDAFSNVLVELVDMLGPAESDEGNNPGIDSLLAITAFATPSQEGDNGHRDLPLAAAISDEVEPPSIIPDLPLATPTPVALGPTLFFCIPNNDKLLQYWDIVEDRLFKIRHCMNIDGGMRQLPLFQPPIDPGVLVKAAAAGVDIASALSDLNAPLPHYRFQVLQQKANELINDVKSLGSALLSALEKRDAEALAILRSSHEIRLNTQIKQLKEKAIEEAEENQKSVQSSRGVVLARKAHYEKLKSDGLSRQEQKHLERMETAYALNASGEALKLLAGVLGLIPDFPIGVNGAFGTPVIEVEFGGKNLSKAADLGIGALEFAASVENYLANKASIQAGHERREQDWDLQIALAEKELEQLDQQRVAAELRIAIAQKDLENQAVQIENAQAVAAYLKDKYTNDELYSWMLSQIAGIYFQSYQLAYDLAKRAEKAFQYELGLDDSHYIQFGYWDNLKKGLLAGEKLQYDLRRLEVAYLEQHKREYELTKHISVALLDPVALLSLRETGQCFINISEFLFDLDHPGHYMRRIKSVSLTIPCVTGPYTSVSCTLTLMGNRVRKRTAMSAQTDTYGWDGNFEDDRFNYNLGGMQSIATSSAQNDSGLFELNFRDDRYLPFEGAGAISQWRLELPNEFRQFDYNTITDVILHINYMSREGGGILKTTATEHVRTVIMATAEGTALSRMFSAKQEFPGEWHQFLHPETDETPNVLALNLSQNRFPFAFRDKLITVSQVEIYLKLKDNQANTLTEVQLAAPDGSMVADHQPFADTNPVGLPQASIVLSQPYEMGDPSTWVIEAQAGTLEAIDDMFIICHYTA